MAFLTRLAFCTVVGIQMLSLSPCHGQGVITRLSAYEQPVVPAKQQAFLFALPLFLLNQWLPESSDWGYELQDFYLKSEQEEEDTLLEQLYEESSKLVYDPGSDDVIVIVVSAQPLMLMSMSCGDPGSAVSQMDICSCDSDHFSALSDSLGGDDQAMSMKRIKIAMDQGVSVLFATNS